MLEKLYNKYMDVSFRIFFMLGWAAEYILEPMKIGLLVLLASVFVLLPLTLITAKFSLLVITGLVGIWVLVLGWIVKFLFEKLK